MIKFYSESEIVFDKEVNKLDQFVLEFIKLLGDIKYVLVSGYVAIFFGRTRATEDVDLFIEKISFEEFQKFAKRIRDAGYWFVNGDDDKELFDMLNSDTSIRIAENGKWDPNCEIRFPFKKTDFYSINNRVKIIFGRNHFYTSRMELQIAFKLLLGTNKDFEDAKHLYCLFEKYLDKGLFNRFVKELNVSDKVWLLN